MQKNERNKRSMRPWIAHLKCSLLEKINIYRRLNYSDQCNLMLSHLKLICIIVAFIFYSKIFEQLVDQVTRFLPYYLEILTRTFKALSFYYFSETIIISKNKISVEPMDASKIIVMTQKWWRDARILLLVKLSKKFDWIQVSSCWGIARTKFPLSYII